MFIVVTVELLKDIEAQLTDELSVDDLWFECKVDVAFELKYFDEPDFKKTIRDLTIDFFKRLSEKKF